VTTLSQITNEQFIRQEEREAVERAIRSLDTALTVAECETYAERDERLAKLTALARDIFALNRILRKHYPVTE